MLAAIKRLKQWRDERAGADGDRLSLEPRIKDVVFIHIPKTGGTSVRNMLVAALPNATKIFDYGGKANTISGDFIDACATGADTPEGIAALRAKLARDKRVLLSGHIRAAKYLSAFHPASLVTFLRDPVDRVVSSYRHHVEHQRFQGSLSDFYRQPGHINLQSRLLWGLDIRAIGFIGLTEKTADMLPALSHHLGIELKGRKDNVSRSAKPTITDSIRAEIEALNGDDIRLYRYVEDNLDDFTNYRSRNSFGLPLARGSVAYRKGTFVGWATPFDPNRLAEIEVRLGTEVVHRCYADQFMKKKPDLRARCVGAFSVRLPTDMLAQHDQVRFVIAGSEKDLDGSPIALKDLNADG